MTTDPVTNRYAEALFSLAAKKGALEEVSADVRKVGAELASPAVAKYLFDARVPADKRRATLAPLASGLHPLTQNLVGLLFDRQREDVLRGLAPAFHRLELQREGGVEGVVESARPLGDEEVARLASALGGRLKKSVTLENRTVPELLGGVRVTVQNRMIDFSVQGRLEGLRRRMLEAPLPTPQG